MVCLKIGGMTVAADFTAPALLALLALMQPQEDVLRMIAACVLHESAHFLAAALTCQKPDTLRISAAGMQLSLRKDALCPLSSLTAILLSGVCANLLAAACLFRAGFSAAAQANLSLGLFNLLPYSSTDGGTLLAAFAEHLLLTRHPDRIQPFLRRTALLTTVLLASAMCAAGIRNPSLWGMLAFMTFSELCR